MNTSINKYTPKPINQTTNQSSNQSRNTCINTYTNFLSTAQQALLVVRADSLLTAVRDWSATVDLPSPRGLLRDFQVSNKTKEGVRNEKVKTRSLQKIKIDLTALKGQRP